MSHIEWEKKFKKRERYRFLPLPSDKRKSLIRKLLSIVLPLIIMPVVQPAICAEDLSFIPDNNSLWIVYTNEALHFDLINVTNTKGFDMNLSVGGNSIVYPAGCELNLTRNISLSATEEYPLNITINVSYMKAHGIYSGSWVLWFNWTRADDPSVNDSVAYLLRIELKEPTPPGKLSFSPPHVSKSVETGKTAEAVVSVTNEHPGLATVSVFYSPDWCSVSPSSFSLNPGATTSIVLTFDAKNKPPGGNFSDFVLFSYTVEGYSSQMSTDLPIRMAVTEQVQPQLGVYRFQITVIDYDTGDPIPQASVRITGDKYDYTLITGESGTATFQNVPGGSYQVKIRKSGYQTLVTSIFLDSNISKVYELVKEQEEEPEEPPSGEERGLIGLPTDKIEVPRFGEPDLYPGDSVEYTILITAEGGPVGPIEIWPDSSYFNWIRLELNATYIKKGESKPAFLKIDVPSGQKPGTYSRQFTITGGKNPATLLVIVTVSNPYENQTNGTPTPSPTPTPQTPQEVYPYGEPVIVVQYQDEDGNMISCNPGKNYKVPELTIVYVKIENDPYESIRVNSTGGVAFAGRADTIQGRVLKYQVTDKGDILIYRELFSPQLGIVIKDTDSLPQLGVYRFSVSVPAQPQKYIILDIRLGETPRPMVGEEIVIYATEREVYKDGTFRDSRFDGTMMVRRPDGTTDMIEFVAGRAEYRPLIPGTYGFMLPTPGFVGFYENSETEFTVDPFIYTIEVPETPIVGREQQLSYPQDAMIDSTNAVVDINYGYEDLVVTDRGIKFTPTEPGKTYVVEVTAPLKQSWSRYPQGAKITFKYFFTSKSDAGLLYFLRRGLGKVFGFFFSLYAVPLWIFIIAAMVIWIRRRTAGVEEVMP